MNFSVSFYGSTNFRMLLLHKLKLFCRLQYHNGRKTNFASTFPPPTENMNNSKVLCKTAYCSILLYSSTFSYKLRRTYRRGSVYTNNLSVVIQIRFKYYLYHRFRDKDQHNKATRYNKSFEICHKWISPVVVSCGKGQ